MDKKNMINEALNPNLQKVDFNIYFLCILKTKEHYSVLMQYSWTVSEHRMPCTKAQDIIHISLKGYENIFFSNVAWSELDKFELHVKLK